MNSNEIIKVFECCITHNDCDDCPMDDNCPTNRDLYKQALELINRLKAENKNCGVKIQNQREQLKACNEKIKEQQAEIERLESKVNRLKRYDEERDIRLHARLIATAKSEAYEEFADKLIRKATFMRDETPTSGIVRVGHIYETLKETGCGE